MSLRRLNPFAGLESPRTVWAWGMYDLANQSFTLIVNTMLFAIFFKEIVVADPDTDDTWWAGTVAASMLLVVLASPLVGAAADLTGRKKTLLLSLGLACALLTCSLGLIPQGALAFAIALYIPANFAFALGENILAAYIPVIAKPENTGRVSGIGWTMGYLGALLLLVITAGAMVLFDLQDPSDWRPLLVFAGLWFIAMAAPTALFVPSDPAPPVRITRRAVVREAARRVFGTLRDIRPRRDLALFFLAFFVYGIGVQTTIFFAGVLAADFGIEGAGLALFLLQITLTAGVGAVIPMIYQDRIGHKATVMGFLIIWAVAGLALAATAAFGADASWPIWVVGNFLGFALGGIGTATRALVGYMTPAHRAAEAFGFWGLVYKLAGVAVIVFGLLKDALGASVALLALASTFILGAIILTRVDVERGARRAREEEAARPDQPGPADLAAAAEMKH